MKKKLLFDWGDTIMRDFPNETGKMCEWQKVEAMPNAEKALKELSQLTNCYIATNAIDSNKEDIIKALKRVNLHCYFKGIFCYKEIGHLKPSKEYFETIKKKINVNSEDLIIVGDNLDSDIKGAQNSGIDGILYASKEKYPDFTGNRVNDLLMVKKHI